MEHSSSLSALIRAGDLASLLQRLTDPSLPEELLHADDNGHTPLHWAALAPAPVLATLLPLAPRLDVISTNPAQLHQTPLHWACVSAPLKNIKALLDAGADPSLRDASGYDAPIHAAQYGRVAVLHLILSRWPVLARTTDNDAHTLLQWAAYYGHIQCVRYLLIVHSVDLDAVDAQGATALHRAVQRNHVLVAKALIRAGADATIADASGKTPYELSPEKETADASCSPEDRLHTSSEQQHYKPRKSAKRYGPVLFYYVTLAISFARFLQISISTGSISVPVLVFSHLLLFTSFICHLITTYGNPGDVVKGTRESLVRHIERCLEIDRDVDLLPSAYCYTCLAVKPSRSKHSSERDVCVRMFDHECPWVNNSIGVGTRRQFLLLVLCTPIVQMVFIFVVMRFAFRAPSLASFIQNHVLETILVLVHSVLAVFCIMLFITQVQLVAKGRTTYEHLVAIRDNVTSNPYDRGVWQNVIAFITSTGPGTGYPFSELNFNSLRDVVFASGKSVMNSERQKLALKEEKEENQLSIEKV
ncbi:Ankyrin repeat containing protein [Gracilaria domingensis]|nr:Ankyrin repeat containing protein [Gracilaria domingensis]